MTTDPVRLLTQQDDAFAASLLRSARDGDAEAARSHKAAVLGAAGGAAVGGAALVVVKLSSRGAWFGLGSKWLAAGALVLTGSVGAGAALLWSTQEPPAPPPVAASVAAEMPPQVEPPRAAASVAAEMPPPAAPTGEAPPPAAPTDPAPVAPAPNPATGPTSADVASAPRATPGASSRPVAGAEPPAPAGAPTSSPSAVAGAPGLSDEVAALRSAHEALGRGQAQKCLEAVDAYFARFPGGHLSAEARFLRVQALAASGQRAQAAALARSMLAGNPRSPYAARLRSIAGEDAGPGNP